MKGFIRDVIPGISLLLAMRDETCREFRGIAPHAEASLEIMSLISLFTVKPTVLSSSKIMVYPLVTEYGLTGEPHLAHFMPSRPVPSTITSGQTSPQLVHFLGEVMHHVADKLVEKGKGKPE